MCPPTHPQTPDPPSWFFVLPAGIAHRDLKPENILCEHPNQVRGTGGWPSLRARAPGSGRHPHSPF